MLVKNSIADDICRCLLHAVKVGDLEMRGDKIPSFTHYSRVMSIFRKVDGVHHFTNWKYSDGCILFTNGDTRFALDLAIPEAMSHYF